MRTGHILKFLQSNDGATAVEYSVVAAGIAMAILGALSSLSDSIVELYSSIAAGV
jgi:pilus assembly protein Flp/PilA